MKVPQSLRDENTAQSTLRAFWAFAEVAWASVGLGKLDEIEDAAL